MVTSSGPRPEPVLVLPVPRLAAVVMLLLLFPAPIVSTPVPPCRLNSPCLPLVLCSGASLTAAAGGHPVSFVRILRGGATADGDSSADSDSGAVSF
mmetsp:Transcript_13339/g.26659  ORF Transcript_13339/g.26659 Transcript_13339/m.26659 type:complete len:96 (+) Transcript_13339:42-329(+)